MSMFDCACIPTIAQAVFTVIVFVVGKWTIEMCRSCCECCGGKKKPGIHKSDWKKDVVYLYQFPRPPTVPNLSPYCLKLETWLRVNKIAYEVVGSFRLRSKNGLLPFVELNGRQIADSQLIIFELQKHFNIEEQLSPEQVGVSRAVARLVEGSTTFTLAYSTEYKNTAKFLHRSIAGGPFPSFLRTIIAPIFKRKVKTSLDNQGLGKFDERDVQEVLRRDIQAIDGILGDKNFICGDHPTTADCTIFGHLATCQYIAIEQPVKELLAHDFPRVKELLERMRSTFWPDWDNPKTNLGR